MVSSPTVETTPTRPFDTVAEAYDGLFTDRVLGRWLRGMVWERLGSTFRPGQHVLEFGCGTGTDAVWLAQCGVHVTATDSSARMLDVTRRKVLAAGVGDRVTLTQLDLEALQGTTSIDGQESDVLRHRYDGVMANFGPMNCVGDRQVFANNIAAIVRPGGKVVLVVMGPICPWEIVWRLGHGQARTAFRRLRSGHDAHVGDGETVRVWYPSMQRLRREFEPHFKVLESAGIGLLLPPSAMGGLVDRAPRLFGILANIDRRLAGTLIWRCLNDHYLVVLERR